MHAAPRCGAVVATGHSLSKWQHSTDTSDDTARTPNKLQVLRSQELAETSVHEVITLTVCIRDVSIDLLQRLKQAVYASKAATAGFDGSVSQLCLGFWSACIPALQGFIKDAMYDNRSSFKAEPGVPSCAASTAQYFATLTLVASNATVNISRKPKGHRWHRRT